MSLLTGIVKKALQNPLASTVGANHSVDVSVGELDVYILVQYSLAELHGNVRKCYHSFIPYFIIVGAKVQLFSVIPYSFASFLCPFRL